MWEFWHGFGKRAHVVFCFVLFLLCVWLNHFVFFLTEIQTFKTRISKKNIHPHTPNHSVRASPENQKINDIIQSEIKIIKYSFFCFVVGQGRERSFATCKKRKGVSRGVEHNTQRDGSYYFIIIIFCHTLPLSFSLLLCEWCVVVVVIVIVNFVSLSHPCPRCKWDPLSFKKPLSHTFWGNEEEKATCSFFLFSLKENKKKRVWNKGVKAFFLFILMIVMMIIIFRA